MIYLALAALLLAAFGAGRLSVRRLDIKLVELSDEPSDPDEDWSLVDAQHVLEQSGVGIVQFNFAPGVTALFLNDGAMVQGDSLHNAHEALRAQQSAKQLPLFADSRPSS